MNNRRHRAPPDSTGDLFSYSPPVPSNPARASDPETSQAAAQRVASPDVARFRATSRQAKLLLEFGQRPMTDFEAAAWVMPANGYHARLEGTRRRCSDLRAAGYLEDSGERRYNPGSPDEAIVWRITDDGRVALECLLRTGYSR